MAFRFAAMAILAVAIPAVLASVPAAAQSSAEIYVEQRLGSGADRRLSNTDVRVLREIQSAFFNRCQRATTETSHVRNISDFERNRARYRIVSGRYGEQREVIVEDTALSDLGPYTVEFVSAPNRCRVSVGPNATHLFSDLVTWTSRLEGMELVSVFDSDRNLAYEYAQRSWEQERTYRRVQVIGEKGSDKSVSLVFQTLERAKRPVAAVSPIVSPYSSPAARGFGLNVAQLAPEWRLINRQYDGLSTRSAEARSMSSSTIEVIRTLNGADLVANIDLDPRRTTESALRFGSVIGVEVDGKSLSAFSDCRRSRACVLDRSPVVVPLDSASVRQLRTGNVVTVIAATPGGAPFFVEWALRGSDETIAAVLQFEARRDVSSTGTTTRGTTENRSWNTGSTGVGSGVGTSTTGTFGTTGTNRFDPTGTQVANRGTAVEDPAGVQGTAPTGAFDGYTLRALNETQDYVSVAVRYLDPNDNRWKTRGWIDIPPGGRADLAQTKNQVIYYHAQSRFRDWTGRDRFYAVGDRTYGFRKITLPANTWAGNHDIVIQ